MAKLAHLLAAALCFAVLASTAVAVNWECRENMNVRGIDLFPTYTIEPNLEICKAKCIGICEFVVYNQLNQCWQKRSWDNGPQGVTAPELGTTACRKV